MFALMGRSASGDGFALITAMMSASPLTVILAVALFMVVCGSLNGTASSTFSREGAQFWMSRVIPVAPRDQVAAKFLHSYLVYCAAPSGGTARSRSEA